MSQAQIKPETFVNFRPEPDPKSPARLYNSVRIAYRVNHRIVADYQFEYGTGIARGCILDMN